MYNKCNVVLTSLRLFARKDWFSDSGGSRHDGRENYTFELKSISFGQVTFGDSATRRITSKRKLNYPGMM